MQHLDVYVLSALDHAGRGTLGVGRYRRASGGEQQRAAAALAHGGQNLADGRGGADDSELKRGRDVLRGRLDHRLMRLTSASGLKHRNRGRAETG